MSAAVLLTHTHNPPACYTHHSTSELRHTTPLWENMKAREEEFQKIFSAMTKGHGNLEVGHVLILNLNIRFA